MRRLAALMPGRSDRRRGDRRPNSPIRCRRWPGRVRTSRATGRKHLSSAVERHIKVVLAAHNDGMGVTDVYDKIIAEVETAARSA